MAPPVENNKTPKKEEEAVVPADTPMAAVSNALGSVNLGSAVARPYSFNFNLVEHNNPNDDDDDDDDDDEDEDNDEEGFVLDMDSYPKYLKQRILFLKHLNDNREEMMKEYVVERAALEAKYAALTKPLYETRARVVKGEFTDEEIVSKLPVHDVVSGEDAAAAASGPELDTNVEHVTGIPQFWVNAMGHMHIIAECMTEQDVECLEHLTDIQCDDNPNGDGFTLSFHFRPNEYFSNTVLTKRYLIPNFLLEEEPVMESVKGCEIMWKPGKCLTYTEVKKTQRAKGGKKSGQIRTIIKKERVVRTEQHQV
jgi:hypothetical protein